MAQGFPCVFPWPSVSCTQAPERREPTQPPAVRAHLGHNASTKELPLARNLRSPRWGSVTLVWPVARPAEEVGDFLWRPLRGRPRRTALPFFVEGGDQSRWAGPSPQGRAPRDAKTLIRRPLTTRRSMPPGAAGRDSRPVEVPALSGALARWGPECLKAAETARVTLFIGNRNARGAGAIAKRDVDRLPPEGHRNLGSVP